MNTEFTIKHRDTGKFFCGFDKSPEFNVVWGDQPAAVRFANKSHATAQAYLLRRFDRSVQIRPATTMAAV